MNDRKALPALKSDTSIYYKLLIVLALCCLLLTSASAATKTVTNTNDSGTGSLRSALSGALAGDTIDLSGVSGTITLTSGTLQISQNNLTLVGPGANKLTISGNNSTQVFNNSGSNTKISGLTIANGYTSGNGGGITSSGTLTLDRCMVTGNSADSLGGGLYSTATITITNSTFSGNLAKQNGGGMYVFGGTVINSTIVSNTADNQGGGIRLDGSNSSFILTLTNVTVTGNTANKSYGGGIWRLGSSSFVLYNSIVSGNTATNYYNVPSSSGYTAYNSFTSNTTTNLKLSVPGWYGGPTQTLVPLPGSVALCGGLASYTKTAGNSSLLSDLATDQRGFAMSSNCSSGTAVNMGAVQTGWLTVTTIADQGNTTPDCTSGTGTTCSLRDAITIANTTGSADIRFAPTLTGTISLGSALPNITGHLNLTNPSGKSITLSGSGAVQALVVDNGADAALSNLTIANGYGAAGGGIQNQGTLSIAYSTLSGNLATVNGGGVHNTGTLTVDESTIAGNSVGGSGGGIYNGGSALVVGTTISTNTAATTGGGIANTSTISIRNSIVEGNGTNGAANTDDCNNCGTQSSYNLINATNSAVAPPALSALQINGAGTPPATMIPLPGSTALCAGSPLMILGATTDERGFPRKNVALSSLFAPPTYCVDLGAVQTYYYGIEFVAQPTNSSVGQVLPTAPTVRVIEENLSNYATDYVAGVPLALTLSSGNGNVADPSKLNATTAPTASGNVATFSGIAVTAPRTGLTFSTSITVPKVNSSTAGTQILTATSNTFTVSLKTQTITFDPPDTQNVGVPLTLTATASSGLNVTYTSTTQTICDVSGSAVTFTATGTCSITAAQSGDSQYAAATPVTQSFTVNGKLQTITFANPGAQTLGTSLTLAATATSGLAVTYSSSTKGVCDVSGSTVSFVSTGNCTITAAQSGDTTWAAATSVTQTFAVTGKPQTITFSSPGTQIVGTPLTLTATASSGLAITYTSSTQSVCDVSGTTATFNAIGNCSITAAQAGDSTWLAATPVLQTFAVNGKPQVIDFTPPASPVTYGALPITLSATGGSSGNAVTFNLISGPANVTGNTLTITGTGTVVVEANQSGNQTYAPAPSIQRSVVVQTAPLTVTSNNVTISYGSPIPTLSGTITGVMNSDNITVTFSTTATNSSPAGSYDITPALHDPDGRLSNYHQSVTNGTLTITAATGTTVALSASPATLYVGDLLTVTARVTNSAGTPDGNVSFYDGTTLLGTSALVGGVATYSTSLLAVGTHSLSAAYSGTANYASATSSALPVVISAGMLEIKAADSSSGMPTITITRGGTDSAALIVSRRGVLTGTVTISCSGLPTGLSCSLSPSTADAASLPATVTLTVGPEKRTTSAANHSSSIHLGWALAMLVPGLALLSTSMNSKKRRQVRLAIILGITLLGALLLSSCGDGKGYIRPGTYTGTVTAGIQNGPTTTNSFTLIISK